MQWVHLLIFLSQQVQRQLTFKMFNKNLNVGFSISIYVFGSFIFSGCAENINTRNNLTSSSKVLIVNAAQEKAIEYIIVVNENAKISDAMNILNKYDVRIIKNLNRGRYLIGVKQDPGIEQLRNDIVGSDYINYIQPNFIYKPQ